MRGQLGVPPADAGQMAALQLPNVAYATNADHGNACGIHPPDKQFAGIRLGNAALNIVFGKQNLAWMSPTYASSQIDRGGGSLDASSVSVTVALAGVSAAGLHLVYPFNARKVPKHAPDQSLAAACHQLDAKAYVNNGTTCGWAAIKVKGSAWLNATLALGGGGGGSTLTLTAQVLPDYTFCVNNGGALSVTVEATAYGWAPIPMMSVYDTATGLPVLPWNRSIEKGGTHSILSLV